MLTYEAPKQSPPALKEENGDSNIQVGTVGDREFEMGEGRLGGRSPFTPSADSGAYRVGSHRERSCWGSLGTGAARGLAADCMR